MSEFQIKRAERSQAFLRLAFTGASFAGKTTASLLLAKGIVDALVAAGKLSPSQNPRIGVIDTERRSAQLYAHLVPFDTIELGPPYSIARYLGALHAMEAAGYPVIILDQISHAWAGQGGMLQSMKGEGFSEWKKNTPIQDEFIDSILRSPAHTIVTMRSKTEWVLELKTNSHGKEVHSPRRIGMAPVQRPGVEYEFTTLLDLQINGDARTITVQKDRTGVFSALKLNKPEDWGSAGAEAVKWLMTGAVPIADGSGPTLAEQAEALCAAAERLMPRQANLPDLARTFETTYQQIKAMADQLGVDAVRPLLRRVLDAKDVRKAQLGSQQPALGPDVAVVTPDDVDTLDSMMMLGGIPQDDFKQEFGVARIAMLPYDAYEEAVTWVIKTAGANGTELARPTRVQQASAAPPPPTQTAKAILERHGDEKSANDLLGSQA